MGSTERNKRRWWQTLLRARFRPGRNGLVFAWR